MLLHFQIYKYFSFCLTRKPYPKFLQISTMRFVIKSSVAHALRCDWKNKKLRSGHPFDKSDGYSNSNNLVVLKNN